MKHIIFVRHAKSSWSAQGLSDHDRPLNERGIRDAPVMAAWLAETLYKPDVIVSSTALRAQQTAKEFQISCGVKSELFMSDASLYLAGMQEWIRVLEASKSIPETIAFFSHNPGITQIVNWLCNEDIYNIPTCGIAIVGVDKDIKRFDSGVGKLLHYQTPKTL